MARDYDYEKMDAVSKLLGLQDDQNLGETEDQAVQAEAIDIYPEAIKPYGQKLSKNSEFYRKNFNDIENESMNKLIDLNKDINELKNKSSQQDSISQSSQKMLARRLGQVYTPEERKSGYDASDYQKSLKTQLDELSKAPQELSEKEKILYAAIPALLGTADPSSALVALKIGQQDMEDRKKAIMEERKAKILGLGKQIEGAANLLKSENELNKQKEDSYYKAQDYESKNIDKFIDYGKWLQNNNLKRTKETEDAFNKMWEKRQEMLLQGTGKISEIEKSELDRSSREALSKLTAQASKERAAIARQEKPTTESERKNASYYAALKQGYDQYQDLKKSHGGVLPSQKSSGYDAAMRIIGQMGKDNPGLLATEAIKSLPGFITPDVRQQISNEISIMDSILRPKTGAAINASEYAGKAEELFARGKTSKEENARKDARIRQELENLKLQSGRAKLPEIVPIEQTSPQKSSMTRQEKINLLKKLKGQ